MGGQYFERRQTLDIIIPLRPAPYIQHTAPLYPYDTCFLKWSLCLAAQSLLKGTASRDGGGGHTSQRVGGGGFPISKTGEKLSTLPTL